MVVRYSNSKEGMRAKSKDRYSTTTSADLTYMISHIAIRRKMQLIESVIYSQSPLSCKHHASTPASLSPQPPTP